MVIVRDVFLGVTRFEDLQARNGIARNVLATRLDALVAHGVLERRVYDEGRDRADYVLTAKGRALWPVLVALRQWGDEWILGEGAEPLVVEHRGHRLHASLTCDECGERVTRSDVRVRRGPGYDPARLPAAAAEG